MDKKRTAVIVFHGMGQQVPYETLGNVAEKIRSHPDFRQVMEGRDACAENIGQAVDAAGKESLISRIRLSEREPVAGWENRVVDVYESYWASLTAGKITATDALFFLLGAGWSGILYSFKPFTRYFWKGKHEFKLPFFQNILSLAFIMLLISGFTAVATRLWVALQSGHSHLRPFEELAFLFRLLHFLAFPVLLVVLFRPGRKSSFRVSAGLCAALAIPLLQIPFLFSSQSQGDAGWWLGRIRGQSVHGLWILQAAVWLDAILIALDLIWVMASRLLKKPSGIFAPVIWRQAVLASLAIIAAGASSVWFTLQNRTYPSGNLSSNLVLYPYAGLGIATLFVLRKFLIEYIGDLAAYLSAHKASKFYQIRMEIQKEAFRIAAHVYASGYDNVLLVGHSLGSVIAYDTLNGLINHDFVHKKGWQVVENTKLLLTFGSPLDKVAFIFRTQVERNDPRELLAAAKQPILEDEHRFRPLRWINVWSRNDVISGPLDFFDKGKVRESAAKNGARYGFDYHSDGRRRTVTGSLFARFAEQVTGRSGEHPVISLVDDQADIPFAAHNQYWDNKLIYEVLIRALNECLLDPPLPAEAATFTGFLMVNTDQTAAPANAAEKLRLF
jgi:hypothetical protein